MRTDGAIITNAGQELLSYALANNKQVNFTKVKLGKGDVNTFDEAKKLTDIVSFYKQIPITSIARNNAGIVRIRSSFTNADFPLQVVLKEIGVFAVVEGKSEVLFGYVNDGEGESFPPGSSGNIVERVRDIYVGVSTNTQVTAVVDRSVVYATIYDLDEEIAKCAKKITRVNPGNGIHGGGTLGEDITVSIRSNDTSINLDVTNGITLKKTTSWLNDAAQLFTAKGALNLFNTLTTNFTDAINVAKEALRVDIGRKEDKFGKNSGFNKEKTDLVENDTNKVFSAKGAFDLKTWLVTNYTTLMNNIRENLSNSINTKLSHGGYGGDGQQLKNEIDNKLNKRIYNDSSILDLNTLVADGMYSGYRWLNAPNNNIAVVDVKVYSRDWIVQIFWDVSQCRAHTRVFTGGNTWSNWNTDFTTSYRPSKSDVGLENVDNTSDSTKSVRTATRLATPRTINGTDFDGSKEIITASWGSSRTFTIGNQARIVNGSGNITWTLNEIGAINKAGDSEIGGLDFKKGSKVRVLNQENGSTWLSGGTDTGVHVLLGGIFTQWHSELAGYGFWRDGSTFIKYWGVHYKGVRRFQYDLSEDLLSNSYGNYVPYILVVIDSSTWYKKYQDGTLEMSIRGKLASNENNVITFPISFQDSGYNIGSTQSNTISDGNISIVSQRTDGITVHRGGSDTANTFIQMIILGRWK